ncbi:hypothetical protein [Planctobacterium marinum]|uniref:Uncharacterized protein n=1 Tax=Planctobacterium marinum TaxID=1631968 RepID=A0AA48HSI9_9ALTE|nr:hypothetical protein MACH26_05740 [Planctobacterium marinum]
MDLLIFTLLFVGILALCVFGYWLDSRYNMQIVKWMNMEVSSPFKEKPQKYTDADYLQLKTRVENLEKIVTEPKWELEQKIKNL